MTAAGTQLPVSEKDIKDINQMPLKEGSFFHRDLFAVH